MKLVYIEWLDAHSTESWTDLEELRRECKPHMIKSVGWLIHEANGHKVIASHISESECGSGNMTIPNSQIKKLKILKL